MKAANYEMQIKSFDKGSPVGTDGWSVKDIAVGRFIVAKLFYHPPTDTMWCIHRSTVMHSNHMSRGTTNWNLAERIYGAAPAPSPFGNLPTTA